MPSNAEINLPGISRELQDVPDTSSPINIAERVSLENERLEAEILNQKLLIKLREDYASKVWIFLVSWTVGVGIVILISGFDYFCFELPTSALTALIGSATVSAIGLVGFIVQGLFK